jgi:hypothetical protein
MRTLVLISIIGVIVLLVGCELETPQPKQYTDESLKLILSKIITVSSPLTDLQKQAEWTKHEGKYIRDVAYVYEVSTSEKGTLYVRAGSREKNQRWFDSDVVIFFEDSEKKKLVSISKGQKVSFEGRLHKYNQKKVAIYIYDAVIIDENVALKKGLELVCNIEEENCLASITSYIKQHRDSAILFDAGNITFIFNEDGSLNQQNNILKFQNTDGKFICSDNTLVEGNSDKDYDCSCLSEDVLLLLKVSCD